MPKSASRRHNTVFHGTDLPDHPCVPVRRTTKKYELMNKKAVEQLSEAVTALRANRFETLAEAAIFCVAATATVDDKLCGVTEISRAVRLPNSTVSRLVWDLSSRGLLE